MSRLCVSPVPSWFSYIGRRRFAGAGAILASTVLAGSAQAHPYIGIDAPVRAASSDVRNFSAATHTGSSRVRNVGFYVDGRRVFLDRAPRWRVPGGVDTRRLSNGRHRLRARALFRNGATRVSEKVITVRNRQPAPIPVDPSPPTDLIAQLGFESGDLSSWQLVQRASEDRIRVVDSPVTAGSRAARFEVRPGDDVGGARAELGYTNNMASEGQERTYSWSTLLPSDYPIVDKWQDIVQWKNEGTGTPPLQIGIRGDQIGLAGGPQVNYRWPWKTTLERGKWLDFTVRIKWSSNAQVGWVEAWYEGQKVLERYPMATLYPGLENYFKLGLYRDSSISQTGVVFHDAVVISR